jgi:hypothetical protein
MSKGKYVHVTPRGEKWAVKSERVSRADSLHDTQRSAIDRARGLAKDRQSELLIHGRDNLIRERNSYGKDPYPPKG